jgi:hypothetical protein
VPVQRALQASAFLPVSHFSITSYVEKSAGALFATWFWKVQVAYD